MREFAQWYCICGLIFTVFAIVRSQKKNIEHDELTGLSFFILWWVWIICFILNIVRKLFKK